MSDSTTAIRSEVVTIAKVATGPLTGTWAVFGEPRTGQNSYQTPAAVVAPRAPYRTPAGPVEVVHLRVTFMVATSHVNPLDALDDALDAFLDVVAGTTLQLAVAGVSEIGPADNAGTEVLAATIDLDVDRRY